MFQGVKIRLYFLGASVMSSHNTLIYGVEVVYDLVQFFNIILKIFFR